MTQTIFTPSDYGTIWKGGYKLDWEGMINGAGPGVEQSTTYTSFQVGTIWDYGNCRYSFLKFDFTPIVGKVVTAASITIPSDYYGYDNTPFRIYLAERPWSGIPDWPIQTDLSALLAGGSSSATCAYYDSTVVPMPIGTKNFVSAEVGGYASLLSKIIPGGTLELMGFNDFQEGRATEWTSSDSNTLLGCDPYSDIELIVDWEEPPTYPNNPQSMMLI